MPSTRGANILASVSSKVKILVSAFLWQHTLSVSTVHLETGTHLLWQLLVFHVKEHAVSWLPPLPARPMFNNIFSCARATQIITCLCFRRSTREQILERTSCWKPEVVLVAEVMMTSRVFLASTPMAPASVERRALTFLQQCKIGGILFSQVGNLREAFL